MASTNPAPRTILVTAQTRRHKPKTKVEDCPWCDRSGCSECDGVGIIRTLDVPELCLTETDADILRKMLVWKSMVISWEQIPKLRRAVLVVQNAHQVREAWSLVLDMAHKSWQDMDRHLTQLNRVLMYAQSHEEDVIWASG